MKPTSSDRRRWLHGVAPACAISALAFIVPSDTGALELREAPSWDMLEFASAPVSGSELENQRGAGLGDDPSDVKAGGRFAVILWDEFGRPLKAGSVRLDTGSANRLRSTIIGAAQ